MPKHTNQTRADDLVHIVRRGGYGHNSTWQQAATAIKKALDKAEKRGWSKGWNDAVAQQREG